MTFFIDTFDFLIDHVCVHLRGRNITVAHQFLQRTQICAVFQKMNGKTVAERVGGDLFVDMCSGLLVL